MKMSFHFQLFIFVSLSKSLLARQEVSQGSKRDDDALFLNLEIHPTYSTHKLGRSHLGIYALKLCYNTTFSYLIPNVVVMTM